MTCCALFFDGGEANRAARSVGVVRLRWRLAAQALQSIVDPAEEHFSSARRSKRSTCSYKAPLSVGHQLNYQANAG